MLGAAFLFALMGVCVKLASQRYGAGEIVMYRSLIGVVFIALWVRWRGGSLRTRVPGMHAWRATVGVISLTLWFYAIGGGLPLATAMTLNYMSSVWMALFLIGGAVVVGGARVDGRLGACRAWGAESENRPQRGQFLPDLQPHSPAMGQKDGEKWTPAVDSQPATPKPDRLLVATVLAGFVGVALVLRPTMAQDQLWHGLAGLASGIIAALAYLQVSALGRVGEPDYRIVFYFAAGGVAVGAGLAQVQGGFTGHDLRGAALLMAVGLLATVAQLMMTRAYAIGTPLINASLHYTGIGFAFLFGVLWFDEAVSAMALGGIALIVAAGVTATLLRARLAADAAPD